MTIRGVDVAVAAVIGAVVAVGALLPEEAGAVTPVPVVYGLGVAFGLLHLLCRSRPVIALLVGVVLLAGFSALFPAIGATWPLVVLLYACGLAGRWPVAATMVGAFLALGIPARLIIESEHLLPVVYGTLREGAIGGLALMLGDAVRIRRRLAAERDNVAQARVLEERVRIARELHDVTAHTLAVVGVQLNVAADAEDTEEMRAAVRTARQVNRDAVGELRAALAMLRDDADLSPTQPAPQPGELAELVETTRAAGLPVRYRETGQPSPLPAPVGLAAYRIVQEALTNVLRHARASAVEVVVDYRPDGVAVRVIDDGAGPARGDHDGHGLVGMRERAVGLDGEFEAGPGSDGGFIVRAWLPT